MGLYLLSKGEFLQSVRCIMFLYKPYVCWERIPMKEWTVLSPKTEGLGRKEKCLVPCDPVLFVLCIYNVLYPCYMHTVRLGVSEFTT